MPPLSSPLPASAASDSQSTERSPDSFTLPLRKGNALPPRALAEKVEAVCGSAFFASAAEAILADMGGLTPASTFTGLFNDFSRYHAERGTLIWKLFSEDPALRELLPLIAFNLAALIGGEHAREKAMDEIRASLIRDGSGVHHISDKAEAALPIYDLKIALENAFINLLLRHFRDGRLKLTETIAEADPDVFSDGLLAARLFHHLDQKAYRHMLANPLGQAQTADPSLAEGYFRAHEAVSTPEIQNNFSYVYLLADQAASFGFSDNDHACFSFRYADDAYLAIPVGHYFRAMAPEDFSGALSALSRLEAAYSGTPAAAYYAKLADFFDFARRHPALSGDAFLKAYHDACYTTECAWVTYVRYAAENGFPFIHIHPFEKYSTTSTKTHDLALAVIDRTQTERYLKAQDRFLENTEAFFESSGLTARFPTMCRDSLQWIRSVAPVSLSARLCSGLCGTIAQNIPNENEGKQNGVVTLCDTDYSWSLLGANTSRNLRERDPVGGLAERYEHDVQDFELFMKHYVIEVLSHELAHNIYKGKERAFSGDGRGLEIKMIEEAKATNGAALAFRDPYHLSPEELADLRSVMPLILPWSLLRLRGPLLREHTSHDYLREGAVILDHHLKSGVLEVAGFRLSDTGEPEPAADLSQADFLFPRLHLDDASLQRFIKRSADFTASLADAYYQTQFAPDFDPSVPVPDRTDIDVWQTVSRHCYADDLARADTPEEKDRLKAARERIAPPRDPAVAAQTEALIRFMKGEEPKRLREAVLRAHRLSPDDPAVQEHVDALKKTLRDRYPQIVQ